MEIAQAKNLYQERFQEFEKGLAGHGQSWALPARREAISRFAEMGFPTPRHEEWKYTNVAPIAQIPFRPAARGRNGIQSETLGRLPFGSLTANRLVFLNGRYSRELSDLRLVSDGLRVESLAAALGKDPSALEPYLARYARYQEHSFVALNTAFIEDGAFVSIPSGKIVEEPIHLFFVSTAAGEATVSHPRNLILVGNDSQVTIVESYAGLNHGVTWTNAVTEIVVGESAVVEHYKLQWEQEETFHTATLQVHESRSSNFTSHSVALGGSLVRNEVNVVLDGEGGECTLNGLYLATGRQHVDNHTRIDHVKPHCTSRELYKGVLEGKARGVFNGKIYVHKAAQKTDARQTNKNLLLSADASVDTKPQLEIYNNDVKCTHGSTIGQLDEDALFYLRARGIGLDAARSLLTYGFISDIVGRVKLASIRDQLESFVTTRLEQRSHLKEQE